MYPILYSPSRTCSLVASCATNTGTPALARSDGTRAQQIANQVFRLSSNLTVGVDDPSLLPCRLIPYIMLHLWVRYA